MKMKQLIRNREYWIKRFQALELLNHKRALRLDDQIRKEFDKSISHINTQIGLWYSRIAENEEVTLADAKRLISNSELDEFKWGLKEYQKYASKYATDPAWQKKLENASARVHINYYDVMKIQVENEVQKLYHTYHQAVETFLTEQVKDTYYRTIYEGQRGFGLAWEVESFDDRKLKKILETPWTVDNKTFSDRIWEEKDKMVNQTQKSLAQATLRGGDYRQAIEDLTQFSTKDGISVAEDMRRAKNRASTVIRTESSAIASQVEMEALNDLGTEKFEVIATLDSRTSDICQEMDKRIYDLKDFEIGVTAPPFHPNCRTTTAPYFDDGFSILSTRKARGLDGKLQEVPGDITYEEWQEDYLKVA